MKYMPVEIKKPEDAFKNICNGVNIRKPKLIEKCIMQTEDYKKWDQHETIKSCIAFEEALKKGGDL